MHTTSVLLSTSQSYVNCFEGWVGESMVKIVPSKYTYLMIKEFFCDFGQGLLLPLTEKKEILPLPYPSYPAGHKGSMG